MVKLRSVSWGARGVTYSSLNSLPLEKTAEAMIPSPSALPLFDDCSCN
jgi:hypothetical protein